MERLNQLDRDELVRRMREDYERTMRQVGDAVNAASDGHLIDGSEEQVRDLLGDFRRRAFETAAQMRIEATEQSPAFSPGAESTGSSRRGCTLDPELPWPGGVASASVSKRRGGNRHAGG
jgi:hypothetical protein